MKREDSMSSYDVVVKKVPGLKVAAIRGVVPSPPDQGALCARLGEGLQKQGVEIGLPCLTLYYDSEPPEQDWDVEVCAPVNDSVQPRDFDVRELPAVETMACVVHSAPFISISEAYAALGAWVEGNGYRVNGPTREVILRAPATDGLQANQTDPTTIVEVQFPIERAI
jgi:effector-binding domain-containing protein